TDLSALMGMAWAKAGDLGCYVKKLELATELDSADDRQQVLMVSEQLAQLIPREQWQAVMAQASKRANLAGEQGEEMIRTEFLNNEQTKQAINLVKVLDLRRVLDVMDLIQDRNQSDKFAKQYFTQLARIADSATIKAEGRFGLACVHAICGRYSEAL